MMMNAEPLAKIVQAFAGWARFAAIAATVGTPVLGGEVEILAVSASLTGKGWDIAVTLRHGDTGWDHYADGWEIVGPDGVRLGYRALLHPHVDEQPFTRSLGGVSIPENVRTVSVRAHDTVHGWMTRPFYVTLSR